MGVGTCECTCEGTACALDIAAADDGAGAKVRDIATAAGGAAAYTDACSYALNTPPCLAMRHCVTTVDQVMLTTPCPTSTAPMRCMKLSSARIAAGTNLPNARRVVSSPTRSLFLVSSTRRRKCSTSSCGYGYIAKNWSRCCCSVSPQRASTTACSSVQLSQSYSFTICHAAGPSMIGARCWRCRRVIRGMSNLLLKPLTWRSASSQNTSSWRGSIVAVADAANGTHAARSSFASRNGKPRAS